MINRVRDQPVPLKWNIYIFDKEMLYVAMNMHLLFW